MGAAYFYHLTDSTLEVALPQLAERALGAGWRVAVRAPEAMLAHLDTSLWGGADESFLPHGIAGGTQDASQPVLLCPPGVAPGNNAACVMAVGGVAVAADEVQGLERLCIVFDGLDAEAVATARQQWKALTDAGCGALYWAQEDGRWIKKAETGT